MTWFLALRSLNSNIITAPSQKDSCHQEIRMEDPSSESEFQTFFIHRTRWQTITRNLLSHIIQEESRVIKAVELQFPGSSMSLYCTSKMNNIPHSKELIIKASS
ncbi:hypothetical protein TNCT_488211 [Trichonephila clavata]|uniref:Uncharacterized protein n=1 Tax=Trichonephila clavata TaxID=2740835 RepID=A0A8X6HM60_TRICU|nr:hypothetical protein TNCT_488211 [Trichonephila clavata]